MAERTDKRGEYTPAIVAAIKRVSNRVMDASLLEADLYELVAIAIRESRASSSTSAATKCLRCGAQSEAGCMEIPCPLAARSSMMELEDQRGNLAMLVRTLVHALRRHDKTSGPADRAMAYLCSKGLQGSPLREQTDIQREGKP